MRRVIGRAAAVAVAVGVVVGASYGVSASAAPLGDLAPSAVSAAVPFVGSGGSTTVSFTVGNVGAGGVAQPWSDTVYLSQDTTLDGTDVALATQLHGSDLAAGASYTVSSLSITIPVGTAPGSYSILVATDFGSSVTETDETNNVLASSNPIFVQGPDLTMDGLGTSSFNGQGYLTSASIGAPPFVGSGNPITVQYDVVNAARGIAQQPWSDQVWLSHDPFLDAGDTLLDTFTQTSNMPGWDGVGAPAPFGIIRAGLVIPANTAPGLYYLIVKLDSGNQVVEQPGPVGVPFLGGPTGKDNNTLVAGNPITVQGPDLTMDGLGTSSFNGQGYLTSASIGAPAFVGSGSPITVQYDVVNAARGIAQQPWSDQVWLSHDPFLDAGDQLLDTFTQTSNMPGWDGVGAPPPFGIIRAGLVIPANTAPGLYYLIVKLDSGNQIVEQPGPVGVPFLGGPTGKDNNTLVAGNPITVQGPDLQLSVPTVALPGGAVTATPGNQVSVTYTVTNAGNGIAAGPWNDRIYLSVDAALDGGDPLLATVPHAANLAGVGGANTYTVTAQPVTIPAATAAGTYHVIVVTDAGHVVTEADETNNVAVSSAFPVSIVTVAPATLPTPVLDAAYSQTVSATGGTGSVTFTISAGALPAGLTLNSGTGVIAGTPSSPGPYAFTVTATDGGGASGTASYSGTIADIVVVIAPSSLPDGTTGQAYTQTLTASAGSPPYGFTVTGGALPTGLLLDSSTGLLSGTPTHHGTFTFTVTATDTHGRNGHQSFTVTIASPPIAVAPASLPDGAVGHAYSQAVTATGGQSPYTFTLTGGTLPTGVALSPDGTLAGNPSAGGPFTFTVTATDADSASGSHAYSVTIAADGAPPVTTATATAPNANGWNKADVTVTLTATDADSGVNRIVYDTGGATTTVLGGTASFVISTEGVTTVSYNAVDNAGNVEATKTLVVKLDKTSPVTSCASADAAWHGANVTLACTASDATSNLAVASDASFTLSTSVAAGTTNANASTGSKSVCDKADNCATAGPVSGNKIDRQAPAITLTKPVNGDVYSLGQSVAAVYSCVDAGAGGGTCTGTVPNGSNVNTATTGSKPFSVTATDAVGNTTTVTVSYTVRYAFIGFIGLSSGGLNTLDAGDPFTLWFSLGGNRGLAILAAGQPVSVQINCSTRATIGSASPTAGTLGYFPPTSVYGYRWTTSSSWKHTCRRFSLTLADGTVHTADFNFTH